LAWCATRLLFEEAAKIMFIFKSYVSSDLFYIKGGFFEKVPGTGQTQFQQIPMGTRPGMLLECVPK
jgi:hypothetical protein